MFRSLIVLFSSALFLLPACGPVGEDLSTDDSDIDVDNTGETSEALSRVPERRSVVGNWTSPACGNRRYARKLQLAKDGHFEAQDLIAPCGLKAACVWSRVVTTTGTYTVNATSIELASPEIEVTPHVVSLPATFGIDRATLAPVEISPEEGKRCVYVPDSAEAVKSP